ncbi:NAD(P)-dependent oxidoreductase [Ectothiorhodospiraceae bacterium BW-2]|nr:NAD(P)-dependent oxidoreductase [Ectothiorhodospiraceae bacterium BW-2]
MKIICNKHNVPLAWGLVFFPYGKGEPETRLIPSLFSVFRNEKKPFGVNANSYRDFLHVSDVAHAFLILAKKNTAGIINISSGEPLIIREVVELIADMHQSKSDKILKLTTPLSVKIP